ncbi:MAG: hypothetical protein ACJ759_08110 [Thermoanaerobaculia bacterium]
MADIDLRLKYFNGQFLQQQDFTAEQEYHLDRQRRHNRQLHTPGIADGLTVTATVNTSSARISPGTALDPDGRLIVLTDNFDVAFPSVAQFVLVLISYAEVADVDSTVGDTGKTRWRERPRIEVVPASSVTPGDPRVQLAKLQISSTGTILQHDTSVRVLAGNRNRPQETFERLRLSRTGVSDNLWPVLSSGAPSQADLAGNLNVTGNILVTGNVDGRDVSADGAKLDNLALSKIGGVSNPGGNIDLVGQTGITITGNDTTNQITFAGGAPTSIDGVTNPGGNIDFVGQGGISIAPDNTGKLIAFSTSPGAIGALPAGDYLRRELTSVGFGGSTANLATVTVNLGFQPKYIWVTGRTYAYLNSGPFGSTISGFCKVNSTTSWTSNGFGPYIYRFNSAPYWYTYGTPFYGALCGATWYDPTGTTALYVNIYVDIASITTTGFVVRLNRNSGGFASPDFYIEPHFACLG